jgi:hypothetical protein
MFDDVLASDPFCGYVTGMARNGVSLGCQVIDGTIGSCTNGACCASQMAAFFSG